MGTDQLSSPIGMSSMKAERMLIITNFAAMCSELLRVMSCQYFCRGFHQCIYLSSSIYFANNIKCRRKETYQ